MFENEEFSFNIQIEDYLPQKPENEINKKNGEKLN